MNSGTTPARALRDLLISLFAENELRRFVNDYYADVTHHIPTSGALADIVTCIVGVLTRNGHLNSVLFRNIRSERPHCAEAIARCAVACSSLGSAHLLVTPTSHAPDPARPHTLINPFQPGGALPTDHSTYVRRGCDAALLHALLGGSRRISIEGECEIGKTSLIVRVLADLGDRRDSTSYIDLQGLRIDTLRSFYDDFFAALSDQLDLRIESWNALEQTLRGQNNGSILAIDEWGYICSAETVAITRSLLPALHRLTGPPNPYIQLILCSPVSPVTLLQKRELDLQNEKYFRGWTSIQVGPLEPDQLEHLFSLLPPRSRRLCGAHKDLLARRTRCRPRVLQQICADLHHAETTSAISDEALLRLIHEYYSPEDARARR